MIDPTPNGAPAQACAHLDVAKFGTARIVGFDVFDFVALHMEAQHARATAIHVAMRPDNTLFLALGKRLRDGIAQQCLARSKAAHRRGSSQGARRLHERTPAYICISHETPSCLSFKRCSLTAYLHRRGTVGQMELGRNSG